ncbi:hypothetical protein CLAFUW4_07532 [Fulvia fulva]|uniref:Uncharacterized protein n=1 Tax=Passalora fulva TaxID=5499 RepID=A0A9Q8PBL4_PASFU|nr:uncharacterized protein CLAFUR5_07662 [Fulvia fulva]KAK4621350.1 hypothetical protein CLAFUR4_07538 [Fulvia fulva]KAK4623007.1 hypothetical protein CLAFUR0_07537 [Fulvia fulva]UJO19476.1 hypothetical protein CLAFUR5_07662 [Fulvia fulva]WPV16039.1 hypothetical protein CLAFUW4_07532 [Fulvia fulva]WPV31651.1 hypothetical protein CLAFUW7_07534 [Fulvia fulva]
MPFPRRRQKGDLEAASTVPRNMGPVRKNERPAGLQDAIDELDERQRLYWSRWEGREHDILPHTDAGGDAYYIGDIYDGLRCAQEWELDNPGPYLQRIRALSSESPHLMYLAHWMEVTASPPKWTWLKHFPENRALRAARTKVGIVDLSQNAPATVTEYKDTTSLEQALALASGHLGTGTFRARLVVVEYLSRDVIEWYSRKRPPSQLRVDNY